MDAASQKMTESTTERLPNDEAGLARAAELLRAGALVAFPTETVYGLGGDARDGQAVARIFEAKGRPRFNPLIVHVPDIETAMRYGVFSDVALGFVGKAWPAGLTLVVPLRENAGLSELVTAGKESVALRVPASPVARALLRAFGGPLAGPSANPSGRISPTTADHVMAGLGGRIAAVVDAGSTEAGLESTIIGCLTDRPVLLREGVYRPEAAMSREISAEGADVVAPGQLGSHYAPQASVRLNATEAGPGEVLLGFGDVTGDLSLSPGGDLTEAAANLFAMLHRMDAEGVTRLAVAPIPDAGLGRAINDRLRRAAAPRD